MGKVTGNTRLQEEQQRKIRESIVSEMLSSGRIDYDRAALELLYYIPEDFKSIYTRVFHEALSATDGNTYARGKSAAETGALGRAPGKAAGSTRKFKGTFFIQDERVLAIKERADKRLRALARDMRFQLEELRNQQIGDVDSASKLSAKQRLDEEIRDSNSGRLRLHCDRCRKFLSSDWTFCPSCGAKTATNSSG